MRKRIFDVLFSCLCLIFLSPLLVFLAIAVKISSRGPVFFVHKRVGRYGREFSIYKFRTMVANAPVIGPVLTDRNDARITRFGRWLRQWSLDELPQFFNVLKGNMSVVGPRPEIPSIVATYDMWQKKVLAVRPGITGLSQTSGRAELSIPTKLRRDIYYIRHQSLWMDLKITGKTLIEVFRRTGAF